MDFLSNQLGSEPVITAPLHRGQMEARLGPEGLALGETALLAITPHDLKALLALVGADEAAGKTLATARSYSIFWKGRGFSLLGPAVGAPVAAILIELMAACGVRRVLALGWCGSLQPDLKAGELVLPLGAIREEGTSYHYLPPAAAVAADPALVQTIAEACRARGYYPRKGTIWTTDALYREARAKVAAFQRDGVLAVDMEASAILAVAGCLGLPAAILLVVSDELGSLSWRPAFSSPEFRQARRVAQESLLECCAR